ncbi:AraC family transcriptional regulator [Chitinophagaceae bacterium 26-R-25]|nr:AraC family transcriptional regulator [Chitinophagaceae bacterium 26-R-25]
MKEIITDWGVDHAHFNALYETIKDAFGRGVELIQDQIHMDNDFAKGNVDFFPLENKIALVRVNVSFAESINFSRVLEVGPDYYACLFSLKEGVDLHVFDGLDDQEMNKMGMSATQSVLYFSSDVQTLFRVIPGEQTKMVILVFSSDALVDVLPRIKNIERSRFRIGQSLKGYTTMSSAMVDKVTGIFEHSSAEHIQPLYLLGAVYELLAILFLQLEEERELLEQSTGVAEVARMVQIRNLLIADFSNECPSLNEMAKKAQLSATKFKILFKTLFKQSYYQYYQRHRLLAARHALILGKSVSDTTYAFSFNSVGNFTVAFKKMFNMSPKELENQSKDFLIRVLINE